MKKISLYTVYEVTDDNGNSEADTTMKYKAHTFKSLLPEGTETIEQIVIEHEVKVAELKRKLLA